MSLHFGYNCINFLPTLNKCRILIDEYKERGDLITLKWLSTRDTLIYMNFSIDQLIKKIKEGEIKAKAQKDGKLVIYCTGACSYDDCNLCSTGGQCYYFKPHNGKKISYIMQMKGIEMSHPNLISIPPEEAIRKCEKDVIEIMDAISNGENEFRLTEYGSK